jgi:O-antigen biosynthesis protein WbqV
MRLAEMPRSLVGIDRPVLAAVFGGPRFAYRVFKDRGLDHLLEPSGTNAIPILPIGAREDVDLFIRHQQQLYCAVGLVSSDLSHAGRDIGGVLILGTLDDVPVIIVELDGRDRRPRRLEFTSRSVERPKVCRLLEMADRLGIHLARLPRLTEFQETPGSGTDRIEPAAIEGLLGRPQAVLDRPARSRHRRRRCHRLGTRASGRGFRTGVFGTRRRWRVRALQHRPRADGTICRATAQRAHR